MTIYSGLLPDYSGAGLAADRPVTPTGYNPAIAVSYFATDTGVLSEWDGAAWIDVGAGGGLPTGGSTGQVLTKDSGTDYDVSWQTPGGGGGGGGGMYDLTGVPAASAFTAVNLQSGTVFGESAGKALWLKGTVNGLQYQHKSAPAAPYRVAILGQSMFLGSDSWPFFGWRDSATTKFSMMLYPFGNSINIQNYDNFNSFNGQPTSPQFPQSNLYWIGLRDDGTTIFFEISMDGVNFITVYTTAKSTGFLGSSGYDRLLFGVRGNDNLPYIGTVRCWDENGLTRTFP